MCRTQLDSYANLLRYLILELNSEHVKYNISRNQCVFISETKLPAGTRKRGL